jgi:hypothetical protein
MKIEYKGIVILRDRTRLRLAKADNELYVPCHCEGAGAATRPVTYEVGGGIRAGSATAAIWSRDKIAAVRASPANEPVFCY